MPAFNDAAERGKMRIKKHPNGNRYLLTPQGMWVRDFTRPAPYVDINALTTAGDYEALIRNHLANVAVPGAVHFDPQVRRARSVVVVSDGHGFADKVSLLGKVPNNVAVIGIGRTLAKWSAPRPMDFYVVNNPYPSCLSYLTDRKGGRPVCLASVRTNPEFVRRYGGRVELYLPVPEAGFSSRAVGGRTQVDDYRNPLCAALGLAHLMGADRILLLCCDETFADDRPGAERLPSGLHMYPQHRITHGLVGGFAHWFRRQDGRSVLIGDHSAGPKYDEIPYIPEEEVDAFFLQETPTS